MRALRYHGPGDLRLDDVPEPQVSPGTAKVAVRAAGICGSDIHEYVGGPISVPMTSPHPLTGETAPLVMGHELAGEVVEVGEGVDPALVGRRVTADAAISCGRCDACRQDWPNICRQVGFHGTSGGGGAFAAYDVLPAASLHQLPDEVPDEVGALVEPLATAVHAVRLSGLGPGGTAVVLGAGPVGLLLTMSCLDAGADVVVVEPSPTRRALAHEVGASTCLDPRTGSVVDEVLDLTGGRGADVAFDAAAAPTTLADAIACTRARGTVVNVAAWERPVEFNPTTLLLRETSLRGSLAYTGADVEAAVRYAEHHVAVLQRLVSRVVPLAEAITTGFDVLAGSGHDDVKVLVRP